MYLVIYHLCGSEDGMNAHHGLPPASVLHVPGRQDMFVTGRHAAAANGGGRRQPSGQQRHLIPRPSGVTQQKTAVERRGEGL